MGSVVFTQLFLFRLETVVNLTVKPCQGRKQKKEETESCWTNSASLRELQAREGNPWCLTLHRRARPDLTRAFPVLGFSWGLNFNLEIEFLHKKHPAASLYKQNEKKYIISQRTQKNCPALLIIFCSLGNQKKCQISAQSFINSCFELRRRTIPSQQSCKVSFFTLFALQCKVLKDPFKQAPKLTSVYT